MVQLRAKRRVLALWVTLLAWFTVPTALAGKVVSLEAWRRSPARRYTHPRRQQSPPLDNQTESTRPPRPPSPETRRPQPRRRPGRATRDMGGLERKADDAIAPVHWRDKIYHRFLDVTVPAQLEQLLGRGAKVVSRPRYTCLITDVRENKYLQRLIEQYAEAPLAVALIDRRRPAKTLSSVHGSWNEHGVLPKEVLAAAGAGLLAPAAGTLAWISNTPQNRVEFRGTQIASPRDIAARYAYAREVLETAAQLGDLSDRDDPLVVSLAEDLKALASAEDDFFHLEHDLTVALDFLKNAKRQVQAQRDQWQRYLEQRETDKPAPPIAKVPVAKVPKGDSPQHWSATHTPSKNGPPGVHLTIGWVKQNGGATSNEGIIFHFEPREIPEMARLFVGLHDPERNHQKGANLAERGFADAVLQRVDAMTTRYLHLLNQIPDMSAASKELLMHLGDSSTAR